MSLCYTHKGTVFIIAEWYTFQQESGTLFNQYIQQSHIKHPGWSYEEEFRIVKLEYPEPLTDDQRKFAYPDHFLKDITLGLRIEDDDKAAIVREGLKKNVPIYQVQKVPLTFKLSRQKLTAEELRKYE